VDFDRLSQIAHTHHPIASPLHPAQVRTLLSRLSPPHGSQVLDLGCGWGAWLVELLDLRPDLTATGVDKSLPDAIGAGAGERGVADRLTWVEADATTYVGEAVDTVISVGASHAFGGAAATLEGVRAHLRPGGQLLFGDLIWERPPSPATLAAYEVEADTFPDLAGLLALAREHGYEPGYGHVSTPDEMDDYEWSWTGSLAEWALREATTPEDREQALEAARQHRDVWLTYRGDLGFVTVVLNDIA
jgi:SAM-dependent methyltransferase